VTSARFPEVGTIEAVWRIEQARLTARLARRLGDIGLAEEVVQEAFRLALERWPRDGLPDRPGAWLMQVAGIARSTACAARP
jgi:predicted RNA polymerase sigma factor